VALERSYEPREVEVELLDLDDVASLGTSSVRCPASIVVRDRRLNPGRPSARYARKLAAGARAHGLPAPVVDRYERAAAEGGRASLALAWLFPLASRIGLVPTAILLIVILVSLIGLALGVVVRGLHGI